MTSSGRQRKVTRRRKEGNRRRLEADVFLTKVGRGGEGGRLLQRTPGPTNAGGFRGGRHQIQERGISVMCPASCRIVRVDRALRTVY